MTLRKAPTLPQLRAMFLALLEDAGRPDVADWARRHPDKVHAMLAPVHRAVVAKLEREAWDDELPPAAPGAPDPFADLRPASRAPIDAAARRAAEVTLARWFSGLPDGLRRLAWTMHGRHLTQALLQIEGFYAGGTFGLESVQEKAIAAVIQGLHPREALWPTAPYPDGKGPAAVDQWLRANMADLFPEGLSLVVTRANSYAPYVAKVVGPDGAVWGRQESNTRAFAMRGAVTDRKLWDEAARRALAAYGWAPPSKEDLIALRSDAGAEQHEADRRRDREITRELAEAAQGRAAWAERLGARLAARVLQVERALATLPVRDLRDIRKAFPPSWSVDSFLPSYGGSRQYQVRSPEGFRWVGGLKDGRLDIHTGVTGRSWAHYLDRRNRFSAQDVGVGFLQEPPEADQTERRLAQGDTEDPIPAALDREARALWDAVREKTKHPVRENGYKIQRGYP